MLGKALALTALSLFSADLLAAECAVTVDSTDTMMFDTKAIEVSKSCKTFTVKLTHSGSLPKAVMGHNWVLAKESDAKGVASDGMSAGAESDYVKAGDARVIAHTKLIGAGESDSVTFDVAKLSAGEVYEFLCTFPGHIAMMKGSLKLVD
ncbi:MAG: azurin [Janthinobacterium lividum]